MGVKKCWIEGDSFSQLRDGLVIATGDIKRCAEVGIDNRRKRIELNRAFAFGNRFLKSAKTGHRSVAVPVMRRGAVRLELNRALKFPNGCGKIEIVEV